MMATVDLDAKARDIRRKLGQLHALSRRSASLAVEIGRDLIWCKKRAGHGNWLPWLAKHRISHDTAERHMALARWAKSNPSEFRRLRNLNVTFILRVVRYGVDQVEELLRKLDSGELTTGKKAATTLEQRVTGLSRRRKKSEPEPQPQPEAEPTTPEQSPTPTPPESPQPEQVAAAAPPTSTNGHAAAAPQAAPPLSDDDDAAAAAFLAAFADHPPPDNVRALLAAFRKQTRLSIEAFNKDVHILVALQWLLREPTPPERGRPH